MKLTIALAQSLQRSAEEALPLMDHLARRAKAQGAGLLVMPEMTAVTRADTHPAEALDGPTAQRAADIARKNGIWILHTQDEASDDPSRPYNGALLIDAAGQLRAAYRKTHLYDAHNVRESDIYTPGDTLAKSVETPWGKLGIGICYELRFPEVARQAALAGASLMVFPAAWVDGPGKLDHWRTLLRARAIENELFVVGCCRPQAPHVSPLTWVGHSMVVDPLGNVLAEAGDAEELLLATVDTEDVTRARDAMPVFRHRRPELYM
jgi:predicted amidohydrolase